MERIMADVKATRRYDSSRRAVQARENRAAVLVAARELFLSGGFAATTVAAIATRAGVSVETVYKGFGGKPGLVRALCEEAFAGDGPVPPQVCSDLLQATEVDARTIIRGFGTLSTEVAPRVAPIQLLARDAAATDPEMAALYTEMQDQRLERMTQNAQNLAAAGHLRDDITVEHAGQVMWTYSSSEVYELLVRRRGWPLERFGAFIADALIAALLPPELTTGRSTASSSCPSA
jgi:AcrR family transcriptional regulator